MRDLYWSRLAALLDDGRQHLGGLLAISDVKAGLYTVGVLENGMSSRQAETAATTRGVEVLALDRYTLNRRDREKLLLGFAAFDEAVIRSAVVQLAAALSPATCRSH
jgi:GntR family transcriptional regulator/MocR family aminotransferase